MVTEIGTETVTEPEAKPIHVTVTEVSTPTENFTRTVYDVQTTEIANIIDISGISSSLEETPFPFISLMILIPMLPKLLRRNKKFTI